MLAWHIYFSDIHVLGTIGCLQCGVPHSRSQNVGSRTLLRHKTHTVVGKISRSGQPGAPVAGHLDSVASAPRPAAGMARRLSPVPRFGAAVDAMALA